MTQSEISKLPNRYRDILKYRQQIPNRLEQIPTDTEKPIGLPTWNTDTDTWLVSQMCSASADCKDVKLNYLCSLQF